ncbi:MAG: glutamate formimidoyltransferase, partial [Bacillota bacterium]
MPKVVECVPNFSEGHRSEVIEAILDEIRAVQGCKLLDAAPDADHNRVVVTFIGEPPAVEEAAFR